MCRLQHLAFFLAFCWISQAAAAQTADTVLLNGKIVTVDSRSSIQEGIAIGDGRILAVGSSVDLRKLAGASTRVVDLRGRTVIPGLIDSHLHAIRAALSFSTEVNWIGAPTLAEALRRITKASETMAPGAWLIVAGGWNEQQFAEKRRPTRAEIVAAAPRNPVYVQLGYGWVVMTEEGFAAFGIRDDADLPAGGTIERDAGGRPTGAISGNNAAIVALFDRWPKPTFEQQVDGTKAFFRELNRLGMTGAVDPGGNNLFAADYEALFHVWRTGEMTVRIAYSLNGQVSGSELEEFKGLTALLPMGFGDETLHFNGLGERITVAMNNNPEPTASQKQAYTDVVKWAAERGMTITMHWGPNSTVDHLLTIFEQVNRATPIADLRWSIAHLNDASEETLARMAALG